MEPDKKKILSLLGLAARSRNLVSGEFMTETAVKNGSAKLVIVSEEASANTKKLFSNKCTYYNIPFVFLFSKEDLGHYIGKEFRSSLAVINEGFANEIAKYLGMPDNKTEE